MFEYYVVCEFCGTRNRLNLSESGQIEPVCGNCKNRLSLAEVEEVISPANLVVIGKITEFQRPEASSDEGCGCGCLPIALIMILLAVLSSGEKKLEQSPQVQQKRIEELKKAEVETVGSARPAMPAMPAMPEAVEDNNRIIKDIKEVISQKRKEKAWRKLKESEKAQAWNLVFQKSWEMKVSAPVFWQELGDLIVQDFSQPPRVSFVKASKKNARCLFSIETSDPDSFFYVKLKTLSGEDAIRIFFKGSHFETKVPPGVYKFTYVTGKKWYGPVFLFGPDRNFFGSTDYLHFTVNEEGEGTRYGGMQIELIKQLHGNFKTRPIDEASF
ncbi:MAG TPA: hypothetical protein PKM56_03955 [Candidatus Rifleibacterium sp.]|nr:hypothetical protein [Candidatus Rifleibacterium sp.]